MRHWPLLAMILFAIPATSHALTEVQLMMLVRESVLNAQGADSEVRTAILTRFREATLGQQLDVASAELLSFSDFYVNGYCTYGWRMRGGSLDCGADYFPAPDWLGCYDSSYASSLGCINNSAGRLVSGEAAATAKRIGAPSGTGDGIDPRFKVLELTKRHQDMSFRVRVAVPRSLLSNLRIGQKLAFTMTIAAFHGDVLYGFADKVSTETHMLTCAKGHEYAPSAGYSFCPIDGSPLH